MIVEYQVIPHEEQRYETVGDWGWCDTSNPNACKFQDCVHGTGLLHVRVSKLPEPRYELLVFYHEMTEALVCREMGVGEKEVNGWDEGYENARRDLFDLISHGGNKTLRLRCGCYITEASEPGDDIHAPYYRAHQVATLCERALAAALGVVWDVYNDAVEAL